MLREELLKDPYPVFRRLRGEAPVSRLEPGGPWLVARHADVLSVLKDAGLFRASRGGAPASVAAGPELLLKTRGLVGMDGPEHARLRGKFREAFAPTRMRELEDGIRELARSRIRNLVSRAELELVGDFSKLFPLEVIAFVMGISVGKARDLSRWSDILVTYGSPDCPAGNPKAMGCAAEMQDFFARAISDKSARTGDGLISFLARDVGEGERQLAAYELLAFLRLLLVAGTETTTHLIGNTVLALIERPGLWDRVKAERGMIPELIEESLRFDGPVPCLIRWASADTAIGGVAIAKGDAVMPLLGSANHDEAVFPEPEKFKLDRPLRPHFSFGAGPHHCMGTMLARLQVRLVFEELFEAASAMAAAGASTVQRVESFFVRGPAALPLVVVASGEG